MSSDSNEKTLDGLHEFSREFNEAMDEAEKKEEAFWESLTDEQRLSAFCCVSRRIFDGEIKEQRSYRCVLYDVFGFGPESYARAQSSGYLAIHNAITTMDEESRTLKAFAEYLGVELKEETVTNFLLGRIL